MIMVKKKQSSPVNVLFGWVRRKSMKVRILMAATLGVFLIVVLKFTVKQRYHFFIAAEAIHALGILVLIYKLTTQKTCSGLSLKYQEVTVVFLVARLVGNVIWRRLNVRTCLELARLGSTSWVVYMMRFRLKASYIKDLDNMPTYYVLVPTAILALLIQPSAFNIPRIIRFFWAFSIYLESVSVLPQLRMMQNSKFIEPFTGHYVFALGVARFLDCAHWIIQLYETGTTYYHLVVAGYYWFPIAIGAEIIHTFILADFCYYYVKSFMEGQLLKRMPV